MRGARPGKPVRQTAAASRRTPHDADCHRIAKVVCPAQSAAADYTPTKKILARERRCYQRGRRIFGE